MAAVTYTVQVDWNNDGVWGSVDDQPVLNRGVDVSGGRDAPRLFAPVKPTSAAWTADNRDKRFTDPSGSIGVNLKLNRRCRVVATDGVTVWPLFTGHLDDWRVKLDAYPLVTADFAALDVLARLANITLSTGVYTGLRTDEILSYLATEAGLSLTIAADVGYTTLAYWWQEGVTALDALNELALIEQGQIFLLPDGSLRFFNRYARVDMATDVATFTETQHIKKLEWLTGPTNVINRVTIDCPVYTAAASAAVWTNSGTVALSANESRVFVVSGSNPLINALTPVAGTDYTVTSGSVTPAINRTSGEKILLTLTAGAGGCTLTGLQLRAQELVPTTTTWYFEDTVSRDDYGIRTYSATFRGLASAEVGRDAAQYLLLRYAQPVPAVAVTLTASTLDSADAVLSQMLTRSYGDRVHVYAPIVGIDWSGHIDGIRHTVYNEIHETTFVVEQRAGQAALTLDDDVFGLLDYNGLGW